MIAPSLDAFKREWDKFKDDKSVGLETMMGMCNLLIFDVGYLRMPEAGKGTRMQCRLCSLKHLVVYRKLD